jgi:hypothetical protein
MTQFPDFANVHSGNEFFFKAPAESLVGNLPASCAEQVAYIVVCRRSETRFCWRSIIDK